MAMTSDLQPTRLRCEYRTNPLGIDARRPRLSWTLESRVNGRRQGAYCIAVASSPEALVAGSPDLWDSGRVASAETLNIPYAGSELRSRQRCFWQVRVWDEEGRAGLPSEPAWFELGLLEPEDWQGHWIRAGEFDASPFLRRTFNVCKPIVSARLYLCGQGVYEARLNGAPVSDQVLGPTLSYFPKRMYYDTFDVTALLREGENTIGVWLAPGWFGDPATWQEMPMPAKAREFPAPAHALLAQLEVRCADGSTEIVGSDHQWRTAASPLTPVRSHWKYCFGFSGEVFDGLRELRGWDEPGFDDSTWATARPAPAPTTCVCARNIEPNRVRATVEPVGRKRIAKTKSQPELIGLLNEANTWNNGTTFSPSVWFHAEWQKSYAAALERCGGRFRGGWMYDLGRHVSGWVEVTVCGRRGDWVCLFGLDCHRLAGLPEETVRLHFAHRVVRYVPVLFFGVGPQPRVLSLRGLDVSTDVEPAGRFACSDPALTELVAVTQRTVEAHLLSGMFMDSWQERFGTFVPGEAAAYGWNVAAVCGKLVQDYCDQQRADGWVGMYGTPISLDYPALNENLSHLPWLAYVYYGDREALRAGYETVRRYAELILPRHDLSHRTWRPPEKGHAEEFHGDHGRPSARWYDPHTGDLYETMAMVGFLRTVERIARLLGEAGDADRYHEAQAALITKCNRPDFLDRAAGLYGGGDQGCHAQALALDIVPPELRAKVADHLVRDIMEARHGHLNTGFGGTVALLRALIQMNRPDVAHVILANETPPSIWSMLRHPQTPQRLTILPEFYTGGMIPHPGLSTVGFWFYQALGGICPDPAYPGFQRFLIRPQLAAGLTWAEVEYHSVRGRIGCRWERRHDRISLTVQVPVNTEAMVEVPGTEPRMLPAAGEPPAPATQSRVGERVFVVPGGHYTFEAAVHTATAEPAPGRSGCVRPGPWRVLRGPSNRP